jgi:hypothetical protein
VRIRTARDKKRRAYLKCSYQVQDASIIAATGGFSYDNFFVFAVTGFATMVQVSEDHCRNKGDDDDDVGGKNELFHNGIFSGFIYFDRTKI